eukprot:Sdes_comp15581_c0_seq1m4561
MKIRTKRPVPKPAPQHHDIYVSRKKSFCVFLERASKLLKQGKKTITIHATGAAVLTASRIALQLQERFAPTILMTVSCDSVPITDNVLDLQNGNMSLESRNTSAIHIQISSTS